MEGEISSNKDNSIYDDTGGGGGGGGTSQGNDVSEDNLIPNQQFVITGRSGAHWTCLPKPSHNNNYVEYLSESSTYLPNTATNEYVNIIGGNYQTLGGGNRVSGKDRDSFYNDHGKAFGFKPVDSSANDFGIGKRVGYWRPDEVEEAIKVATGSSQDLTYAEGHAAWKADSVGDKHNASKFDPMGKVGAPSFLPKSGGSSSNQKSNKTRYTDRERRQRIADNLKALHELLPNPEEGSQAYVLDDIIDYVKYLQHQIKELSGSKLQADSNAIPLVFHEGYGHYIKQQMLDEPLEEIMGKLLEEHSAAANQLLENKGLFLMPIALVDELSQAIQLFGGSSLG
ncbi:uncharacterized protein [Cicer arietinum]|uniref:Transcription factor bHLH83 n=1 Tax=Cicer arietinum TaxID=3827 RepID=A0A1S2XXP9_CICAR|nr:transcription factor bHLH83 [Cicer arietinum]